MNRTWLSHLANPRTVMSLVVVTALQLGLSACSEQWREADSSAVEALVPASVDELTQSLSASSGSSQLFMNLYDREATLVYYAFADTGESPRKQATLVMGRPWSLLSLTDFSIFQRPDLGALDLTSALIMFINDPWTGESSLVVKFSEFGSDQFVTRYFNSQEAPYFENDELVLRMDSGLVLRTYDVDEDGILNPTIQLRVYSQDNSGTEYYIGKISTLIGFQ
ncbi:MAG: hypothetical protein KDD22_04835 [Bdellovibrionales bacterium]|nr:hypothetical protein [Bdellovibrionales bacterium]